MPRLVARRTVDALGRDEELAAIGAAIEAIAGGGAPPAVIAVTGPAGIGKTTLLDEALRRAAAAGALVLRGTGQESAAAPFGPIAMAMRPVFPEGDPLSALTRRAGAAPSPDELSVLSQEGAMRVVLSVIERLDELSATRTVVLAIDDVHWADGSTIELLGNLVDRLVHDEDGHEQRRLAVVLVGRPTTVGTAAHRLTDRLDRLDDIVLSLDLGGLDHVAVEDLVLAVTGAHPSRPLLRDLVTASGGNPLMVRSLLARLEAFGALTRHGDELRRKGGGDPQIAVADLDRLLHERLAGVSESCLHTMTVAAFLGDRPRLADVAAVSAVDPEHFRRYLDEGRRAAIADDDGESLQFEHPQIRQLLLQRLRGRPRAELHHRIAEHLDAATAGDPDPPTVVAVAHHLRRAGSAVPDDVQAAWQAAAGRAAEELGAWPEAIEAYEAALDVTPDMETSASRALLLTRAARAHWWNHDNPRAAARAEQARLIAAELGDIPLWAAALEMCTRPRVNDEGSGRGPVPDMARYDAFFAVAGDAHPAEVARVHQLVGLVLVTWSDVGGAASHIERARSLAPSDDDTLWQEVSMVSGLVELYSGSPAGAIGWFEQSLEHAERTGDRLRVVWTLNLRALGLWTTGRLDEALTFAERASSVALAINAWAEHALGLAYRAGITNTLGDVPRARTLAQRASRVAMWCRSPWAATMALLTLSRAEARLGDPVAAHAALDSVPNLPSEMIGRLRALVAFESGGSAAAVEMLRRYATRPIATDGVGLSAAVVELAVADASGGDVLPPGRVGELRELFAAVASCGISFDVLSGLSIADLAAGRPALGARVAG